MQSFFLPPLLVFSGAHFLFQNRWPTTEHLEVEVILYHARTLAAFCRRDVEGSGCYSAKYYCLPFVARPRDFLVHTNLYWIPVAFSRGGVITKWCFSFVTWWCCKNGHTSSIFSMDFPKKYVFVRNKVLLRCSSSLGQKFDLFFSRCAHSFAYRGFSHFPHHASCSTTCLSHTSCP